MEMLACGGYDLTEIGAVLLGVDVGATTISLSMRTNVDCSPKLYYSVVGEFFTESQLNCAEMNHEHAITGLTADTTYQLKVLFAVGGMTSEYLPGPGVNDVYRIKTAVSGGKGDMLLPGVYDSG